MNGKSCLIPLLLKIHVVSLELYVIQVHFFMGKLTGLHARICIFDGENKMAFMQEFVSLMGKLTGLHARICIFDGENKMAFMQEFVSLMGKLTGLHARICIFDCETKVLGQLRVLATSVSIRN